MGGVERERELIVDLEACELADLAVAIDEPSARAIEHADLAEEALLDHLAPLAARGLPQLDRAAHAAALVAALAVDRAERADRRTTTEGGRPRIDERLGVGRHPGDGRAAGREDRRLGDGWRRIRARSARDETRDDDRGKHGSERGALHRGQLSSALLREPARSPSIGLA